jgi:hypothetical protein
MNNDRYLKIVLTVIAGSLLALVVRQFEPVARAQTEVSFQCQGELTGSPLGLAWPGGYTVDMKCN